MSGGEGKEYGFYRPAMAPSFVDSRRNARMGLGLNLGGCCPRITDVTNSHYDAVKIVPIAPRRQQQQRRRRQEHSNPLFVTSDEEKSAMEERPWQASPSPSPQRIQPSPSPSPRRFQPSPSPSPSPRRFQSPSPSPRRIQSSPQSSPLVIPEFPSAEGEDENRWGGFLSPASRDSLSCSSLDPDLDRQRQDILRWKGVDLPVYEGQWDADAIEEWVSKMDAFFQICGRSMSEEEKIQCAVFHLTGAAHKWWRIVGSSPCKNSKISSKIHQDRNGGPPGSKKSSKITQQRRGDAPGIRSWKELKAELVKFFKPSESGGGGGDRSLLLRRLEGMKQDYGMPLRDYDQQFLEVYLDAIAVGLPTWDVVVSYVEGLWNKKLSHLLTHMISSNRVSLQTIMRLASFFESDPSMVCPWCNTPLPFSSCS